MTLLFVPMLSGCLRSISRFDDRGWDGLLIGIQSYREGRYREAIPVLLDVIESYPGAPLLEEAQWFLAKSYLGEGDKGSAARELQFFLQNYPNSSHEESAHS
ncbi:MAG: tol-pal system YbgF family protein, partial [Nitrospiria bacterium]